MTYLTDEYKTTLINQDEAPTGDEKEEIEGEEKPAEEEVEEKDEEGEEEM